MKKIQILIILFITIFFKNVYASELEEIVILGNKRISPDTIKMFSDVNVGQDLKSINLNNVLKNLYNTNFFTNVSVEIKNNQIIIEIDEAPIIESIEFNGVKSDKILNEIKQNLSLKSRSSYNDFLLQEDKVKLISTLKSFGYYFAEVDTFLVDLNDNKLRLEYQINLGEKSKIRKINFVGNKIFKNRKLRSLIISEEYKFWKFISGTKFLNENVINLDERLLKNFYLNKGYYNAEVNSSFAKMINENEFELIFNINAKDKIFFNDLSLELPSDFQEENFTKVLNLFKSYKGKPYSINLVENILEQIELITINEQYLSVKASVEENIVSNKLNLIFKIEETEKVFVERINIFGNTVTQESVIRNQLEIDEGDPFNEILHNKSVNNIKSLNFFKDVKAEVINNDDNNTKNVNITVQEKPTGEIFAGAGAGTNGGTISVGIKENNYLGKGIGLRADGTLTEESFKGQFRVTNPNYKNTNKSIFLNIQALETDRLSTFGYKNNKTGFDIGTGFEYLDDMFLNLSTRTFFERIETNSSASARQKKQAGNYWDTFVNLKFDYDKRNQKFKTSDGFRSTYGIDIPMISDTNTVKNSYSYKYFTELYDDNISSLGFFIEAANSLSGDDIKLSERLYIPSSRLRGFERGKVGPKDGDDFIGGNYITTFNLSTTVPQLFTNLQEVDVSMFFDAANVWGVDYDSSLADGNKIRSSIGLGIDWFTAIGPVNFSLSEPITKSDTDITESFRFNIGTSF